MRRKVLNHQQMYRLIREQIEAKVEEQEIKEAEMAFRRSVLQHFAEELRGESADLSQLDEGLMSSLFDKAKSFIGGSGKQQASFTKAVEKATSKETQTFFQKLEKIAPGFPNTKGTEKFLAGLALLQGSYAAFAKAAAEAETQVQRIASAAAATDIANYAQEAVGDVSRTFKYFKEGEDDEDELNERVFTNYNKALKLLKLAKSGEISAKQMKKLNKIRNGLEKEFANRGGTTKGMTNKEQDLLGKFSQNDKVFKGYDKDGNPIPDAAPEPEPTPEPEPEPAPEPSPEPEYDPSDDIEKGYQNQGDAPPEAYPESDPETGLSDYDGDAYPESELDVPDDADFGTSDLDPSDLGGLPDAAGDGAEMINVLGMPIAKGLAYGIGGGLAAVAVGALAYKAYKTLKAKRERGDSREGMLKGVAQQMSPVEAKPGAPEAAPEEGGAAVDDQGAGGAGGTGGAGGAGAGGAGGAGGDEEGGAEVINVFRGKGGAGMQSQLAKAGIQGKDMSNILKGLRADLTDAGFKVMEEAKRRVIALGSTLGAIEQIADPAQKEAAKKAVVGMLRQHGVKLDPKSSMALKPSAAPEQGGAEAPTQAPAGGKPPLDPAQAQRAAASNAAQAQRGAPAAQAAAGGGEDEEEEKKRKSKLGFGPGSMKDASSGLTMEEEALNETLQRWHKLAGIIKG